MKGRLYSAFKGLYEYVKFNFTQLNDAVKFRKYIPLRVITAPRKDT